MRTITVKVTQEHIDKGSRWVVGRCALARAIRGAGYPKAIVVVLYWQAARGKPGCKLSLPAQRFRKDFDNGKPVRPATFRLQAPDAAPGAERTRS